jgi:hypothetical protein
MHDPIACYAQVAHHDHWRYVAIYHSSRNQLP